MQVQMYFAISAFSQRHSPSASQSSVTSTMPTESTPLVSFENGAPALDYAKASARTLLLLVGSIQLILLVLFVTATTYNFKEYSPTEYVIFRDIMTMLLLGFGFLMTFLKKYGLGAVGLTMMLTVISVQLNIFMELGARFLNGDAGSEDTVLPLPLSVASIIDGEFSAATLLISYGAVIGRASPVQLVIMAVSQSFFYAFNKVVLVFGVFEAEDVGGTMTIHMFGAYFGLAASYALGPPKPSTASNATPDKVSDLLALIGTTILWVYWPSFVGGTETGVPENERLCIMHTIFALLGSTGATFFMTILTKHGKLDPVHVANSTLAGGVAVGSSARLAMTPGGSLLVGVAAGMVSVLGYVYSTPTLEKWFGLYDTCGVGNLHGWPSIFGGLASAIFVIMDSKAEFLTGGVLQPLRQLMGVAGTLVTAILSGYATGVVMKKTALEAPDDYDDSLWWEGEYFEGGHHDA
jgi:ammonium transporter Rh